MKYYKGLIAMRKAFDVFTDVESEVECLDHASGMMVVSITSKSGEQALVIINPNTANIPYALEGEWNLVADGELAGAEVIANESGNVTVDARSVRVYVKQVK